MRIAIIGTGIAGMVAAYLLSDEHELVVYEAEDYVADIPTRLMSA